MTKVLDLFCGTKSLKSPCEKLAFDYFGVDIDGRFKPDMVADVLNLFSADVPFIPDIVWASPPCTHFSVASIGKNWNKDLTPKNEDAKDAMELVKKTIRLIEELCPKYWFIENPRGMLRMMPMVNRLMIRHTVTYCQYGDTRMKPTDIWTNNYYWQPRPACKNGDPCHERAPRGARTGTQGIKGAIDRGRVPEELLCEILEACR